MIKILDTFSGVGGFHLALQQSIGKENVECIGFCEIDKFAKQVYKEHFSDSLDLGDITKLDIDNLPDFDLLTGGFPCQDVSVAGKQDLSGGRTVLVEHLFQILEKKKPKYFVFENVKGLMSDKFYTFRESIFERIRLAGYLLDFQILNTKDFGLPQNRERVFMVGQRIKNSDYNRNYIFPQGQELITFLKDILEEEVDRKYFLSDKFKDMLYKHKDRHDGKGTGFGFKPKELIDGEYASTLRANAALCPTDNILRINNPTHSNNRVYDINGIYPQLRKLTPTEYARLQGFPDNWSTDFVSNSQAYKQMGNAISVPVVKAIFDNLFEI